MNKSKLVFLALCTLLIALCVAHALIGSTQIPLSVQFEAWLGRGPAATVFWQLRLPRLLQCIISGALLGVVGSAFQALFRNPLADPYLVGVSSGAAVGGAVGLVTGFGASWIGFSQGLGPVAFALIGGLATLSVLLLVSRKPGLTSGTNLLLYGVMLGSLLNGALSLTLLFGGIDSNQILRWLLGSMTPAYWNKVAVQLLVFLVGFTLLSLKAQWLSVLALGEEPARRLGLDTRALQKLILIASGTMVSVSVGCVGMIGFLGLAAPHIARKLLGVSWKRSLPGSAICGAAILIFADILAQRIVPSSEAPVGVLTAMIGAPWLLKLLRNNGIREQN